MKDLRFRSPALVLGLLGMIADDTDPTPWNAIIDHYTHGTKYTAKTIENTLADLAHFGAVQRIGQYLGPRKDSRAVRLTILGAAWLAGELLPIPTEEQDTDQ